MQSNPIENLIVRYQKELDDLTDVISNMWYMPKAEKAKNPNFWAEFGEAENRASQAYTTLVALQRENMGLPPMTCNLLFRAPCKMNHKPEQKWFHFLLGQVESDVKALFMTEASRNEKETNYQASLVAHNNALHRHRDAEKVWKEFSDTRGRQYELWGERDRGLGQLNRENERLQKALEDEELKLRVDDQRHNRLFPHFYEVQTQQARPTKTYRNKT